MSIKRVVVSLVSDDDDNDDGDDGSWHAGSQVPGSVLRTWHTLTHGSMREAWGKAGTRGGRLTQPAAQGWGFLALTIHLSPGEKLPHKREQYYLLVLEEVKEDIRTPSSPRARPSSDQLHSWRASPRLPRLGTGQTCLDHETVL